jgi:hypothetical protein
MTYESLALFPAIEVIPETRPCNQNFLTSIPCGVAQRSRLAADRWGSGEDSKAKAGAEATKSRTTLYTFAMMMQDKSRNFI